MHFGLSCNSASAGWHLISLSLTSPLAGALGLDFGGRKPLAALAGGNYFFLEFLALADW